MQREIAARREKCQQESCGPLIVWHQEPNGMDALIFEKNLKL